MKHFPILIFIILSSVIISRPAFGQVSVGIKGGLNLSNFITGNDNIRFNQFKDGYHTGFFARMNFLKWIAVQPELVYNIKGRSGEFFNYQLNYIDLPVLIVINPVSKINVHFGSYASVLADASVISNIPGFSENFSRDSFSKMDYGLSIGTALDFKRIGIGIRYNQGMVEIANDARLSGKLYNLVEARNSVWQLYLSLNIIKI